MHSEFDRQDGTNTQVMEPKYDQFAMYRRGAGGRSNALQTPMNTRNKKVVNPETQRQYVPESSARKRYTADDMQDNSSSGSLWHGDGKDSFLFTSDLGKKIGDILVLNVMGKLKDEITAELKRAFPAPVIQNKEEETDEAKDKKAAAATAAKEPAAPKNPEDPLSNPAQVYDKISSVIIEEVNQDHILVSGRKFLLFRNKKHLIEVQALVNRKNVSLEDNINSNDVLESSVSVIR
jgi:flagellar L-ring protein precursor FlgH